MPAREQYDANEGQGAVGAQQLMAMIGQSKNLTAGWVGFAAKSIMVSSSAGTAFGLVSYMLLHGPLGPALSFLAGSGLGFVGGLVHRWRTDVAEALHATRHYPRLIEHHVRLYESGKELRKQSFEQWSQDLHRSPRKQGIAICALYSAAASLSRIQAEQEEAVVLAYSAAEVEEAADGGAM